MAKANRLLLVPLFATIFIASSITESQAYSTMVSAPPPPGPEKFTHLHFYFHDIASGDKPSAVKVAEAPGTKSSVTAFGAVTIMDDPLTEGPDMNSRPVGRAQGMYASADQHETGLLMVANYLFAEGEFNGSYVTLYGRNPVNSPALREMPIVGGSGAFRFARGYAQAKTYSYNHNGNAVVEYNMYIWHY